MILRKKILAILGAGILLTAVTFPSMASSNTISEVSITINSAGNGNDLDVSVSTDSSMYHLDKASVIKGSDIDWKNDEESILEVDLTADDGYTFSKGSYKKITINGSQGTIAGVKGSNSDLTVFISLSDTYINENIKRDIYVCDLNVYDLEWDEIQGVANWNAAADAEKYQVQLYRGSQSVTSVLTAENTSFDFSDHITKAGSYTYKIRAISDTSLEGGWKKSEVWHVNSEDAGNISSGGSSEIKGPGGSNGSWLEDEKGWKYKNTFKRYIISNWDLINGKWYYFNESGYMTTGWINWKDKWYYCGDDGAMDTDTTTPDGYHVGNDGAWTGV